MDLTHTGGSGAPLTDYDGFGETLLAPADGRIVEVTDSFADNPPGTNGDHANHLVLNIGDGRYVLIAHLNQGSVTVKVEDEVRRGQPLAAVGNNGHSSRLHHHLQVQNSPAGGRADDRDGRRQRRRPHGLGARRARTSRRQPYVHLRSGEHRSQRPGVGTTNECRRVADLQQLLHAAGVSEPYLLVGHSFGGISMRLYAATYPDAVIGVVLVDPTPPTFVTDACAIVDTTACQAIRADFEPPGNEGIDIAISAEALVTTGPFPEVPVVILAADLHQLEMITDPAVQERFEAMWQKRQHELAANVTTARVEVVASGHDIQSQHPEAVVEAIRSVMSGPAAFASTSANGSVGSP